MLEKIWKVIKQLGELISAIVNFVVDFVEDLVYAVKLVAEWIANIPDYFSWLPASLVALLVTIFAIVAIYKILGRD